MLSSWKRLNKTLWRGRYMQWMQWKQQNCKQNHEGTFTYYWNTRKLEQVIQVGKQSQCFEYKVKYNQGQSMFDLQQAHTRWRKS